MDILVPRSRGKRKQGRSQSLPARTDTIFREKTEEILRNENAQSKSAMPPQMRETTFVRQMANETCPQPGVFDDWSHLEPDERGAELAREARVWKVYVGESDKWDKELVEGWDKSMDVLLVFAALFSAISTTFLIESSGALKQDPNDVSAAALLAISQALVTMANGNSSTNPSTIPLSEQTSTPEFVPSHNAVIVNVLWYLSLSLSIATAFLAMLAKDWCYSFSAHRTGHPRDQAHRRQRKWKLIERWKMQELIVILPSLMHVSLLLFAIGLCVYLWDLNHTTAIPVMCVAGAFLLFYIWSSVTASLVEDFPYTTIISRIMRSNYMRVLYPTIIQAGNFAALLPVVLLVGIYFIYLGIILAFFMIANGLYILLLLVSLISLQCCFRKELDFDQLFDPFLEATYDIMMRFISLPFRALTSIKSYFSDAAKRLELTEDLTTSLALSWLIQYCETPTAVDIALQAIAGASRRIPKEPLLSTQATAQIMRRIVSHGASDKERSRSNLYTRSLEFLGLNSRLRLVSEKRGVTGDIEVMVWDLKSKNERVIAELIKDGSFVPSDNNLEAMRIGNSAASRSLNIWRGETKNTSQSLHSIMRLLSPHLESIQDQQLHPAAVQSLANATALHSSLSTIFEQSPDMVGLCMKYCEQLIYVQSREETAGWSHNFGAGVAFIVSVLLLGRPRMDTLADTAPPIPQPRTRALHAIRTLIDVSVEEAGFREYIFWVGCSEILSNRSEYGLDQCPYNWESLENWCSERASNFMHEWGTPVTPSWNQNNKELKSARNNFLKAVTQVYELVIASRSHDSTPIYLPESIHTILMVMACGNALDSWQIQTSTELLSEFGFPRLSQAFIDGLEMPTNKENECAMSAMGTAFTRKVHPYARRHFAASQLWLLLDFIDGAPSEDQQRLKTSIETILLRCLQLQCKEFDQVKRELEAFIIEGYQKELGTNYQTADDESPALSLWNTIKTKFPVSWTRAASEYTYLRLGTRLNALQNSLRSDIEGRHSLGKHQRVYTARIIQRILEKGEFEGGEDLESLIEADFEELLPCYQKLLPTLAPLPPSRTISQASLAETEGTPASPTSPSTDTGHVSVEIRDPPGTPTAENRNLD